MSKFVYDYNKIIEVYKSGIPVKDIPNVLGCCLYTVYKAINDLGADKRDRKIILTKTN